MRAANPDVFAFKNSGLGAFLYADVGAEDNGSTLTILSMLARLGIDPWAQAAGWASMPQATAIEDVSNCIAQMPLAPGTIASREMAERLVRLLPGKSQYAHTTQSSSAKPVILVPLHWLFLAAWILLSMLPIMKPATDGSAPAIPPVVNVRSTENMAARTPP